MGKNLLNILLSFPEDKTLLKYLHAHHVYMPVAVLMLQQQEGQRRTPVKLKVLATWRLLTKNPLTLPPEHQESPPSPEPQHPQLPLPCSTDHVGNGEDRGRRKTGHWHP